VRTPLAQRRYPEPEESVQGPSMRTRAAILILVAICAIVYLPGLFSIPPIDRDEARFAQATRQMVASGDYVRPRFGTEDRLNKPIGIYWLQAVSLRAFGIGNAAEIWPYRLPSVIGALIAVLFTYRIGRILFDEQAALTGAIVLASSALLTIEAHQATTDAVLLACVTAEMACFAAIYLKDVEGRPAPRSELAGFWMSLALGGLVKGPVLPALTITTLSGLIASERFFNGERRGVARWVTMLKPQWGIPLAVAIVAPWIVAVTTVAGPALVHQSIVGDLMPRFEGIYQSHGGPPGYYAISSVATFWPGSLLIAPAIIFAVRNRFRPSERFCLAWMVPGWMMLEMVPTKLPHYALPLYPAMALMIGAAASRPRADWMKVLGNPVVIAWTILWAVITSMGGMLDYAIARSLGWGGMVCAVVAVAGSALAVRFLLRGRPEGAIGVGAAAACLVYFIVMQWQLPSARSLWPSRDIRLALSAAAGGATRPVAAIGYQEPSLIFSLRQPVLVAGPESAADFLARHPNGIVVTDAIWAQALAKAAADRKTSLRTLWTWEGLNYTKNERIRLEMFERDDAQ